MKRPTRIQASAALIALLVTLGPLGCVAQHDARLQQTPDKQLATLDISEHRLAEPAPPPPLAAVPPPLAVPPPPAPVMRMAVAPLSAPFNDYPTRPENRERYDGKPPSPVHIAANDPVSTFSIDVDTGAYANSRRFLAQGLLPPQDAVRTEELVNYFRYDYPLPQSRETPFSVTTDMAQTPWNPVTRLLRIGLRGYDLPRAARPPANLVFLIDVSGSMSDPDKLPLVKSTLALLARQMGPRDKVSIVVYAGAAGVVLAPTSDSRQMLAALDRLEAGGSTAGGEGLKLAYDLARQSFIEGGVNRVLLATDGDFNVGVTDTKQLIGMVERERDSGVTLTTLGFGQGNYNEAMMEQIADHGNGNYAYIDGPLEANKVLNEELASTLFTIARDVKIQVEFNPAQVSQYRLIGYENRALREEDFDNDMVDAGEIGAGHQVTALYEIVPAGTKGWIGPHRYAAPAAAQAITGSEMAMVKLRYKLPQGGPSRLIERPVSAAMLAAAAPPRGDMAFAVAVAAYGQRLRGDAMLHGFGWRQIEALAGPQQNPWRAEFTRLVEQASTLDRS